MKNPLKHAEIVDETVQSSDTKATIIKIGVALAVTAGAVVAVKVLNRKKTDNEDIQD